MLAEPTATWQSIEEALAVEPEPHVSDSLTSSTAAPTLSDSPTSDSLDGGYPLRQAVVEHVLRSGAVRKVLLNPEPDFMMTWTV